MISVVSMSRRPDLYSNFVKECEEKLGTHILEYLVFVNDPSIIEQYRKLEQENKKVRVLFGAPSFVYQFGHDSVYNYLDKQTKGDYILKLFDTDTLEVDPVKFENDMSQNADIYGMPTYMQRGDVWEIKWQLYKKGILTWFGLVHENQHFNREVSRVEMSGLKVKHFNSLDNESAKLKKTQDGFIILEKTEEGSDSDKRNMLYETLAWKIVNENGRHDARPWFVKHYSINGPIIDWYYQRAKQLYKL